MWIAHKNEDGQREQSILEHLKGKRTARKNLRILLAAANMAAASACCTISGSIPKGFESGS